MRQQHSPSLLLALATSALLACSASIAFAQDWNVYRGGAGMTGVAAGKLSPELKQLWRYTVGKAIRSSPVVAQGKVFVGANDGKVHAIDLATGKVLWTFQLGSQKPHPPEEPAPLYPIEASPVVHEGKVLVGGRDGLVYALDAASGKLLWTYETAGEILGSGNLLLDDPAHPRLIVGSYDNRLHCIDLTTGKAVWTYETENYINGAPAIEQGNILFGGCDGLVHILRASDGQKLGEVNVEGYVAGTAAMAGGKAFLGTMANEFVCVDVKEKRIAWKFKDREFAIFGSPALAGDRVYFGNRGRRVYCLNTADGSIVWEHKTKGRVDSSPVLCDGKLVFGSDDGRVTLLDAATGQVLWQFEAGEAIASSPAVVQGTVIVGSDDGSVYAFGTP